MFGTDTQNVTMDTLNSPVELPAGRHSFVEFPMTANIQDPTSWDALVNDGDLTRHNSKQTIASEHAGRTARRTQSRPSSRGQQSVRAKASPSMEVPPQELEAQPVTYFPPRQSSAQATWSEQPQKQNKMDTQSDTGHVTQGSDDYTGSTSSASTAGTSSLPETQVYSLPALATTKPDTLDSPVLSSSRSVNSVKKPTVPTSKYKKKPPPSLRSSIKRKSDVESPLDSPMSNHKQLSQPLALPKLDIAMPQELPAALTSPASVDSSLDAQVHLGQAPLHYAKSTASVRKARALHSHPSMPTLRSADLTNSPPMLQPSPNLPALRTRKSVDTSRNRPSLYELQEPSPAPNAPLPDLPTGVQPLSRPTSRGIMSQPTPPPDAYVRPGTSGSTIAPTLRRQDQTPATHMEMASFMTSSSKVIFRRFHDVHVRLLLTLQDEISALEKELAEIESTEHEIDVDRETRRVMVMSDLRRLLAEYDHLFTNWNIMQGSKADAKTREELEKFLKRSGSDPSSSISASAVDDLLWVKTYANDLSCLDLNVKKEETTANSKELPPEKKEIKLEVPSVPTRSASNGGGFAALFASCAGKRK